MAVAAPKFTTAGEDAHLARWQDAELVVLGTTYPNYSMKYLEVACTGVIDVTTFAMSRIHPMPKRYLEDGQRFQNFQRIRVRVQPNSADGRPESLRVDPESITPLDVIPAKNHAERRRFLERSPNLVQSVEDMQQRQKSDGFSLGAIVPKEIRRVYLKARSRDEIAEWHEKERELFAQQTMAFLRPPKKLDCPAVEFRVAWTCDDVRCKGHDMSLKTWGLHEQYRKLANDPARDKKVIASMERWVDVKQRDVFFFLGTFVGRRFEFGLMDAFSTPKDRQLGLFDA